MPFLSRRAFLVGASTTGIGFGLASCVTASDTRPSAAVSPPEPKKTPAVPLAQPGEDGKFNYAQIYAAVRDDKFPVPAIDLKRINPAYLRAEVAYNGSEPPGTVVVDTSERYLYLVQPGGRAMRYGVGVGRQGFAWAGEANIKFKREWPDWYPPREMIQRQPELKRVMSQLQSGVGMHGGPRNPLGARAMYLWQNNKDTLFRIHGTVEPWSVGKNVSSGCIRMINQDAIDLYERVELGATVVVRGGGMSLVQALGGLTRRRG